MSAENRTSKELVAKFRRGDVVRWNALCGSSTGWVVQGLEHNGESLLPIYKLRKGHEIGSAMESELETQRMQPCRRGNDDCPEGCCK